MLFQREVATRAESTYGAMESANLAEDGTEQDPFPPVRPDVTTPTPVFPFIRPSLTPPRSPPALPVVERVNVHAEIAAPHPIAPRDAAALRGLNEASTTSAASEATRKGKKRARRGTPSPPPSLPLPTRPHPGAIPRTTQVLRTRHPQTHRAHALAPSYWTTPTRTYRHLAPATAAIIEAALRPDVAGAGVASTSTAPSAMQAPPPRFATTPSLHQDAATGLGRLPESSRTHETEDSLNLMFPMDLDAHANTTTVIERAPLPFDIPSRRPNTSRPPFPQNPLRTVFEDASDTAASPTIVPSTTFGSEASTMVDDPWAQMPDLGDAPFFPARPATPRPQVPPPATPAAARFQSQSASALAAMFIPPLAASTPSNAATPPNGQGPLANTATYLAAHNALNPGLGGGYTFTDAPDGGFPEVLFAEPDGLFAGLPRDRINAICGGDIGPAIILHVHNSTFPPQHDLRPLTSSIEGAIRQITGELNPLVVPPEREWTPGGDRRVNPFAWMVLGISEESAALVLTRPVWSATEITMHVATPHVRINRFLFVLGGFAHDRNHSILNAVWAVFTGPVVLPTILRLVQTHPDHAASTPEEAARAILASLEVRVSTLQNGNIIAAVFCDPPTLSIARWREWRNTITNLPFPNPMNSTGFVRRPAPCAGCHGCDHPTHLCPFQDVPGWNAPPPGTTWGPPPAGQLQGPPAGPPPPHPPPGGGAVARSRSQGPRRTNSSNTFVPPRRDYRGGGDGKAGGSGSTR